MKWDDGHVSSFPLSALRESCTCALCQETRRTKPSTPHALPVLGSMERNYPDSIYPIGRYAMGIRWKDAHESIFPYDHLVEICPCDECKTRRAAEAN